MENKIIQKLKEIMPEIKQRYPLDSVAVFGSITRNDFSAKSDVDILIDFKSDDFLLFNELAEELEKILGKKIDLVTTRSLKPRQIEYLKDKLQYV